MNITFKRNYGYELIFEVENVKHIEDIEERDYPKKEDGKFDFSQRPKRDISITALEQFSSILEDMIYYREKEFDSSSLIEQLYDKLPEEKKEELIKKLWTN